MSEIESAFHVLGLADAHELDLKADMVDRIGAIIKARELTQARAGELMGMGQAEVSKMLSGHLDRFTVDRLIKALAALGERVRVSFEPFATTGAPPPGVLVAAEGPLHPAEVFEASGKETKSGKAAGRARPTTVVAKALQHESINATTRRGRAREKNDRR